MAMKNNKQRKSWFGMQRERFGDNWATRIRPEDIYYNTYRILLDIARGNFEMTNENNRDVTDLYNNPIILNNMIDYCGKKWAVFSEASNAIHRFINDPNVDESLKTSNTSISANLFHMAMECYKACYFDLDMFRQSGDIGYLYNLQSSLKTKGFRDFIDLNRCL